MYRITWSVQAQTLLRVLHKIYHQNSREWYFIKDQEWKEGIFLGYPKKPKQSDRLHWLVKAMHDYSGWEWSQYPKESYNSISTPVLHSKQNSKINKINMPINSYRLVYSFHCCLEGSSCHLHQKRVLLWVIGSLQCTSKGRGVHWLFLVRVSCSRCLWLMTGRYAFVGG